METDLVGVTELFPHINEEEEDEDSASPLIDLFVNDSGAGVFKALTPFTRNEFEGVWDDISLDFCSEYSNGRGRQPSTKPKDALFIVLSVLKLPTTWQNHGVMFGMKPQKIKKLFWKSLDIAAPLV